LIHSAPAAAPPVAALQGHTAIFGGTFDPVHDAHLAMARAALEHPEFSLRRILFVPASNPPHKNGLSMASWEDRVRMLQLACAGNPQFEISLIEKDANPSYSILTIERLLAAGSGPLAFLIGADAFAEIRTWHRWQDVIRLVEFIVVTRPGSVYAAPEGSVVHELSGLELPVSSSEIRNQIARGQNDVAIPQPVFRYIREHRLYQSHLNVSLSER
jgi:nicotinate-nucleotide adenylyltransferase